MNRYFTILLIVAALTGCKQKSMEQTSDKKAIQALLEAYQDAFNYQDAEKLGTLWAPDAILTNPATGEAAEGRANIIQHFKDKFALGKEKRIEIVHKQVTFPSPDIAVEHGLAKIDIADQPAKQAAFEMTLVKKEGKWLIDEVGEIELSAAPSNFEHLRALNFLEGDWEDTDPNTDITFETKWDKYKNFLTQHFSLNVLGEDILEGKLLIAWDPLEEKIRSWVFDSDGGFGEGTWKQLDKSWYVAMKYTQADGSVATATHIYTPVSPNAYTFASVDREVDGEILPNLNAVTVERVK